jgi:outer membrane protein OmpA-like peptidoglycan-associated protein
MKVLKISAILTLLLSLYFTPLYGQEIIKNNLSDSINTSYVETKPMISADGNTLFFARQNTPENINGRYDEQDIYFNKYGKRGWSKSVNIGEPLNNEMPNGVVSISPNGESLYLLNAYVENKKTDGVAVSHRTDSGWSVPQILPIQDFHNHSDFIDYFFSSNGQELLIAVERDDSFGDQDLYVSRKLKDNSWSKPINLGQQINTKHPEFSPFLAADNKTLFFASMGHENYGGADIFYSKRLDSTWTNWSKPENLGPDVNTESFEAYYTIPANGTIGYYVSDKNGRDNSRDIFSITIPYQFRPDPVILLTGEFLLANNEDDSIDYHVNFLTTSASESEIFVEYESNSFNAILPTGGSYFFYVNKSGHISESHYIDLEKQTTYKEETADIHTVPIRKDEKFTSHNIQFEYKTDEFVSSTYFELVRLLEIFQQNEGLQIEIIGHAHEYEDSVANMELSLSRITKIKDFYVEQGFNPQRLLLRPEGSNAENADNYKKHVNSAFNINNRIDFLIKRTDWKELKVVAAAANESASDSLINQSILLSKKKTFKIHFAFDSYTINEDQELLTEIAKLIKDKEIDKVDLIGYTCSIGDEAYNKYLAEQRAKAVKQWMKEHGLRAEHVEIIAEGEANPIADNDKIEKRALNRRVELTLSFHHKSALKAASN